MRKPYTPSSCMCFFYPMSIML